MPAELTPAQVEAVAALANLELDSQEVDLFARQLGEILAYVDQLHEVDTTGIPPTAYVAGSGPLDRNDVVAPSFEVAEVLANAPDADTSRLEGGFFRVPRVIG